MRCLSIYVFVHLSVTFVNSVKMNKHIFSKSKCWNVPLCTDRRSANPHSSPVESITAMAFCTVSLHKSSVDFRWFWTLPPVWSSVLADMNTSRRPFATCFIGSQFHSEQFKIAIYAFDCVREPHPAYFNNVCIPVAGISGRANLRLAERHDMLVPSTRTPLGWNALPWVATLIKFMTSVNWSSIQWKFGMAGDKV